MAKRPTAPAGPTPVDSIKHKDTRKNIPTEELRDFVAAEEAAPPRMLYEKLKRALRAEIDEAAWSSLYSTVSRPFAVPETGKIAVKVINHYGDEVLKVFTI
jgi:hypothetical protein